MRNWITGLISVLLVAGLLAGCGGSKKQAGEISYKDGTYTARSGPDERGSVGEVTLVVENGRIVKADYRSLKKDGTPKDEDYGKTNGKIENQEFYKKAQQAVKASGSYPVKLLETQDVDAIDAIAGATVSYQQFREAVNKALGQASPVDAKSGASISLKQLALDRIQKVFK
ncbi:FMN-binding protein|uniref:Major membrane immunogen, membrane-anchored lipoprotein n=1 Tax=Dendrosporobacter quercicolus TaxID=146817 RepID=A0A1G9QZY5_9FIRM|nr:FMN-binding protein [Dendrosporobacter quercicolus]NSL48428.1 FMN-binding protein [Dendrosporobacter quercicolus DSM 1736]SDM16544.1 Major membrane immunogen, membrane-anchored lipoprotein [Dendrosporobacter quercicolus]